MASIDEITHIIIGAIVKACNREKLCFTDFGKAHNSNLDITLAVRSIKQAFQKLHSCLLHQAKVTLQRRTAIEHKHQHHRSLFLHTSVALTGLYIRLPLIDRLIVTPKIQRSADPSFIIGGIVGKLKHHILLSGFLSQHRRTRIIKTNALALDVAQLINRSPVLTSLDGKITFDVIISIIGIGSRLGNHNGRHHHPDYK